MDRKRRAFYEYHACLMEPWDGPAAMAFTDGRQIGATLDRNGLRPARYLVTKDDTRDHVVGSPACCRFAEENIVKKWRLQPGKMLLIDLEKGRIISDEELKAEIAASHPVRDVAEAYADPGLRSAAAEEGHRAPKKSNVAAARSAAVVRLHAGKPSSSC